MATLSIEIEFKSTATNISGPTNNYSDKTFGFLNYSNFEIVTPAPTSLNYLPADNRGLFKVTSPLGVVIYDNTDTANPDIIPTVNSFNGLLAVVDQSPIWTITTPLPSTLETGTAVNLTLDGTCNPFVTGQIYFIKVLTPLTFELYDTEQAALIGTSPIIVDDAAIFLGQSAVVWQEAETPMALNFDGSIIPGEYKVQVTYFDIAFPEVLLYRTSVFTYNYVSPKVKLDSSYQLFNPAYLTSSDKTNYGVETVTFGANHQPYQALINFTINYPQGGGSWTVDTPTLSTNGFYAGSPAVHGLVFHNDLRYFYNNGFYEDGLPQDISLYVFDYVSCNDQVDVWKESTVCDLYCCLKEANNRMVAAEGTASYNQMRMDYLLAQDIAALITLAFNCGKAEDIGKYMDQFQKITNCSGDCNECDDDNPIAVIGIGTLPNTNRRDVYVFPANVNDSNKSYQSNDLIGLSWTNGDFLVTIGGKDISSILGYETTTWDSMTGTMIFQNAQTEGAILTWYKLKL
jgi:hypothetical protein